MEINTKKETVLSDISNSKTPLIKTNQNLNMKGPEKVLKRMSTPLYLRKILNQDPNIDYDIATVQTKLQSNKMLCVKNDLSQNCLTTNTIDNAKQKNKFMARKSLDENNIRTKVLNQFKTLRKEKYFLKYGSELKMNFDKKESLKPDLNLRDKIKVQSKSPITDRPRSERRNEELTRRINKKMSNTNLSNLKTITEVIF